jgi:RNA polymerase sigma-70 factor (ECF subfamily)
VKDENRRVKFEAQVIIYQNDLKAFAQTLAGNWTESKDLVQDTLLRAFVFFDRFEPETQLKAWLFTLMKNIYISQYRKKIREALFHSTLHWSTTPQTPEAMILRHDIQTAIQTLPGRFRTLIILKDLNGYGCREIALMLDCPIGSVMSGLSRGRSRLRNSLTSYRKEK